MAALLLAKPYQNLVGSRSERGGVVHDLGKEFLHLRIPKAQRAELCVPSIPYEEAVRLANDPRPVAVHVV